MAAWDLVVIGGGAAGLSAAAAAAGMGLSCVVIDRMGGGGELMNLGPLHDLDEALTGPDLAARLLEDATAAGVELEVAEVAGLASAGPGWRVTTDGGPHDAQAVILAVGLAPGTLNIANEAEYESRGLSHCAACDGPLCRGEAVVVAGADRWAMAEARDLSTLASKVTLVTQGAAEPPPVEGVTVLSGRIVALAGDAGLDAVVVEPDGGARMRLPAHSVFVQTGRRPAIGFAPHGLGCDADGRIIADGALQTALAGVFVAGDARAGAERTLAHAMADGRLAAAGARARVSALGKSGG